MTLAIVDPEICRPEECENGICAARRTCPTRAIYQESPLEVPYTDPQRCRSCSKCLSGCPLKAIHLE